MKHVRELAIIGALSKVVKTSHVRTTQGCTYRLKHGLFHWFLLHTYHIVARVVELSQNKTLTHGKLQSCQTQRSDMQITAEILQTYDLL